MPELKHSWARPRWSSSRVYGLSGEALLNFGPLGVGPMFAIYGGLLGWYRRKLASWDALDARLFLAPFFTILFVAGLVYDSDNLVFFCCYKRCLDFCCHVCSLETRSGHHRRGELA